MNVNESYHFYDFCQTAWDSPWTPDYRPAQLTDAQLEERERKAEERRAFCKNLQQAIDTDNRGIICLWSKDEGADDDADEDTHVVRRRGRKAENAEEKRSLSVFLDNGARVGKFAGILHYPDENRTVFIHSRFDGDRKDRFLTYALSTIGVPVALARSFAPPSGLGMVELLQPYIFLEKLAGAYRNGPFRQYRNFDYNDSRLRGRIDVARHIRLNPMPGGNGRVAYSVREYSLDNPINHLILATYGFLRKRCPAVMESALRTDRRLRRPIEMLLPELGQEDLSPHALQSLMVSADKPITHPMHRGYEELRRLCLDILRGKGVDPFAGEGENVSGVLIPMDRVWERVLETMLAELHPDRQRTTPILDGRRILKPDLLLEEQDAVLDAKYRLPWSQTYRDEVRRQPKWTRPHIREDVFQVMSYMFVFDKAIGGVIFPYPSEKETLPGLRFPVGGARETDSFWMLPFPIPTEVTGDEEAYYRQMETRRDAFLRVLETVLSAQASDQ